MNYDKIISPEELQQILENEVPIIIDLREQTSFHMPIAGAEHIPLSKITTEISKLPKDRKIILYCWHGVDSFFVMNLLTIDYGFDKVYSLKGGIEAWYKFKKKNV